MARARITSLTKQSNLTREQAEKLRSRLRHAVAFYEDHVDWGTLALMFELTIEHHELLDTHLARIEQRIKDLHDHAFPNDPLRTLPGVRPVVGSTVRALVGDAREFTNLAVIYRRLMSERGRHHHQAVCAVARQCR